MKTLSNYWFIAFCLVWLLIKTSRNFGLSIPGFNNHLTDLLAIPVISNLALAFQRKFIEKSEIYCLKPGHILFIVAYTALVFEFILPRYSDNYIADILDVLMYVLGGLIFWSLMNRPVYK